MASFAERLKECRKAKGLTQKQAAVHFGVAERHWQNYESGGRTPTFEGLLELANYFEVSIDYLVGRTDNPGLIAEESPRMQAIIRLLKEATEDERDHVYSALSLKERESGEDPALEEKGA